MKEGDFIVRIWPSGRMTFGIGYLMVSDVVFKALESYSEEGGVTSGSVYGYVYKDIFQGKLKHRLATQAEIIVYNLYGGICDREDEIKSTQRDCIIDNVLDIVL